MYGLIRHIKLRVNILVALAVFFNAIAPLSVVAKEFTTSDDVAAEELFGDKIFICTPTGYKYISIEELHQRQNDGQDEQQYHCPLSQINVSENMLISVDLSHHFEIEFPNSSRQFDVTNKTQKPTLAYRAEKPRAPPFFL